MGELVYIVEKTMSNNSCVIVDVEDKAQAERLNKKHLTTIIVPFLANGENKGKRIIHNRYHKTLAKLLLSKNTNDKVILSKLTSRRDKTIYNLFGGHVNPPIEDPKKLIDSTINEDIIKKLLKNANEQFSNATIEEVLINSMLKELREELLIQTENANNTTKQLQVWGKDVDTGKTVLGNPYPVIISDIIPIGFTEYEKEDKTNNEISYVFALPIPSSEYNTLIAADDYEDNAGTKHDIYLPIDYKSIDELRAMKDYSASNPLTNSDEPVREDAIARLFMTTPINAETSKKLRDKISSYP